jgi:squalene synthase HpnC
MTLESFIYRLSKSLDMSIKTSVDHYENFPVASLLLPAQLRPAVSAIYAFARSADDLADEGDATPEQRIAALTHYEQQLTALQEHHRVQAPLFQRLAATIVAHQLPMKPFFDLLSAFKQDVVTKRYERFETLCDYCARSANPVGLLMLHLYQAATEENCTASDAICSALQLINFWQDVAIDWQKQRIYLPLEDLRRFHITEQQIADGLVDPAWQNMMRFQCQRARELMLSGSPLCKRLPRRIGWELRLVVQGGLRILEKIEQHDGDVFRHRPRLNWRDWILMAWRAVCM